MADELSKEWENEGEELMCDLLVWANNAQLTQHEAEVIRNSILKIETTEQRKGWIERMSAQIDRSIVRSRRRIDQAAAFRLQLQTYRIERQLRTGSLINSRDSERSLESK